MITAEEAHNATDPTVVDSVLAGVDHKIRTAANNNYYATKITVPLDVLYDVLDALAAGGYSLITNPTTDPGQDKQSLPMLSMYVSWRTPGGVVDPVPVTDEPVQQPGQYL